jgi:hypothetical protein
LHKFGTSCKVVSIAFPNCSGEIAFSVFELEMPKVRELEETTYGIPRPWGVEESRLQQTFILLHS